MVVSPVDMYSFADMELFVTAVSRGSNRKEKASCMRREAHDMILNCSICFARIVASLHVVKTNSAVTRVLERLLYKIRLVQCHS